MFEDINHGGDGGLYGELLVSAVAISGSNVNASNVPGQPDEVSPYDPAASIANGVVTIKVSPNFAGVVSIAE